MVPTAKYRVDGNCPKEGVELVLPNFTTSVIVLPPSELPPAIKYCLPVNQKCKQYKKQQREIFVKLIH